MKNHTTIDKSLIFLLPQEILAEIFKYIPSNELPKITHTCKIFNDIITNNPAAWQYYFLNWMGNSIKIAENTKIELYGKKYANIKTAFFAAKTLIKTHGDALLELIYKSQPANYQESFITQFLFTLKSASPSPLLLAKYIATQGEVFKLKEEHKMKFTIMDCFAVNRKVNNEIDMEPIVFLASNSTFMLSNDGLSNLVRQRILTREEAYMIAEQVFKILNSKIDELQPLVHHFQKKVSQVTPEKRGNIPQKLEDISNKAWEKGRPDNKQMEDFLQMCLIMHAIINQLKHWGKQGNNRSLAQPQPSTLQKMP